MMKRGIKKTIKEKDIESTLWLLLEQSLEEIDKGDEPKLGKTTVNNIISALTSMETMRRRLEAADKTDKTEDTDTSSGRLNKWITNAA